MYLWLYRSVYKRYGIVYTLDRRATEEKKTNCVNSAFSEKKKHPFFDLICSENSCTPNNLHQLTTNLPVLGNFEAINHTK